MENSVFSNFWTSTAHQDIYSQFCCVKGRCRKAVGQSQVDVSWPVSFYRCVRGYDVR